MDHLKSYFSGADNVSGDIGRVIGLVGGLAFIAIGLRMGWIATIDKPFDYQAFGIGFGIMVGSIAGMLKLKASTEPKAPAVEPNAPTGPAA